MTTTPSNRGYFRIKDLGPKARAVRFTQPDLVRDLYHVEPPTESGLFHDLEESLLESLAPGDTVVVNFARIAPFGSPFYRLLLYFRRAVRDRQGRLVLCRLGPNVLEFFDLVLGHRIFTIVPRERDALWAVRKGRHDAAARE